MTHPNLPIILLAAGASSRMRGRDKLLEQVEKMPLLRLQAMRARGATAGPVLVTLPPAPHPRYPVLDGLDVRRVSVQDPGEGMAASLRAGIAALPENTPCAMVLLADLPEITSADLISVACAVDLSSDRLIWRGATQTGAPGHPIVFHARLFPALSQLRGDTGGREVVQTAQGKVTYVPLPGNRARRDLDTPEDWAAWRAHRST